MPARLRLTALVTTAIVVVALAAIVLLGNGDSTSPTSASADPTGFHGAVRPPGAPVPELDLRDQDGRLATMREYRGRPFVLTFMYSTCEDTCPLTAQQIRGAIDDLGRAVPVLAVSVDPRNDTRFHIDNFLVKQRMNGRMRFLTGTRAQLEPIWQAYGIQPQGEGFEHSASTVVIDADGRQRVGFLTSQLTSEGLAADLKRLGA
ncbi:SCO family protein [Conexibacter sp. JD483]|uniref:SCO family protein n=1 Tax=unclassified Conexibacter TaxID=2627773 RepID=UPI00271D9FB3|nr:MULTISPECIES: SCO family protein [unclassified Conexibacter]MDO8188055.1 SCO family protein [Conexibacter sp. CPCC 205706]MDO8200477.1 SCO family protein [Conexibacter sp. CPCC 205762]MDR9369824.1 SCO family protein [Conexibacter sp. JD483]